MMQSLPIKELSSQIQSGQITSVALVEACLGAIASHDRTLNAFITVFAEETLARARQIDQERASGVDLGPLH